VKYYIKTTLFVLTIGIMVLALAATVITSWLDMAMATVFALLYTFTGFISFSSAMKLKSRTFYTIIFSSMIIRMAIMSIIVIMWLLYQSHDKKAFLIAFILWYMVLLIPEILSLNRMHVKELS
jgi:hypothetical protein